MWLAAAQWSPARWWSEHYARAESLSTPEHREVAQLLLQKAREDLSAAQALIATEDQADYVIGFHLHASCREGTEGDSCRPRSRDPSNARPGLPAGIARESGDTRPGRRF